MKIGGIIAEYNPFHNGHRYQIEQFKLKHNITHLVVVMSGNFVQRGDVAIIDKFKRSKMAIQGGADLILELPVCYALSTAEYFALGGIYLLNSLGCVDTLSFGSSSDIDTLTKISKLSNELRNSNEVLELMNNGLTFPNALAKVVSTLNYDYSNVLGEPNNVLGLEYIRALNRLHSNIEPTTLVRKNVQHNSTAPLDNFASASYIRNEILKGANVSKLMPNYDIITSNDIHSIESLERVILYKLRCTSIEELQSTFDVSHGLEHRILQATKKSTSLNDLLFNIKSKRYTLARIRRIVLNVLLGITKQDISTMPPYARILAMNTKGTEILSIAKKRASIPIGTSLAKLEKISTECKKFATLESKSTDIYELSSNKSISCGTDYTHKIELIK